MTDEFMLLEDYERFRVFLKEACGIVLGENKHYLVKSRLRRILEENGFGSVGELVTALSGSSRSPLRKKIIDAMTTNETYWFRDHYPFETLQHKVIPELIDKGLKKIRIWSAACSSGQEPYSLSMIAHAALRMVPPRLRPDIDILATDVSPSMLEHARRGIYDELALSRGLSPERRAMYFEQHDDLWRVKKEIAQWVTFKEFNLMNNFSSLGKFDIIFCRNVLIYFSPELKRDIFSRLARVLESHGYLFLGGSESLTSYSEQFETVRDGPTVIYRLKIPENA